MRKLILITGIFALFFTSCYREPVYNPYADFGVDYSLVIPGEVIFFNNYSDHADYYLWDFGDGYTSSQFQPTHYYQNEGVYRVTLEAHLGNKVDYAYLDIEVYSTTLEVEVVEWATEIYVPNVKVTLFTEYHRYEDENYYELSNDVGFGYTNQDGYVIFKDLETISYYVDAWNNSFNNFTLGWEHEDNIKTTPLEYAAHNVFTAFVDRDEQGKMVVKSTSMRVIPKTNGPTRALKNLNRVEKKTE